VYNFVRGTILLLFGIDSKTSGKTWFCGADVAKALGYSNTRDALSRHCKEDGVVKHHIIDSIGRTQQAKFISEGNIYKHYNKPFGSFLL